MFFPIIIINFLCLSLLAHSQDSWQKFNEALQPFLSEPVDDIVVFGSNCLPKFRVNSYCTETKKFQIYNHLFDWMIPLNYSLLAMSVDNNFTDAFDKKHLTIKRMLVKKAVYNTKYQFIFVHAFDNIKGWERFFSHTILTTQVLHNYYHLIDGKFKHLTRKSQEAIHTEKKMVYLIYGEPVNSDPKGQRQEDYIAFTNSIKKQRNDNFIVLVLVSSLLANMNEYTYDTLIEGNLIIHQIDYYRNPSWECKESVTQWNNIFEIFAKA